MKHSKTIEQIMHLVRRGADYKDFTQSERVILWFCRNNSKQLDPMTAWKELGIYRLSAVMFNLRAEGYNISTQLIERNNKFSEICLVGGYTMGKKAEVQHG